MGRPLLDTLNKILADKFGVSKLVRSFTNYQVNFDLDAIANKQLDIDAIKKISISYLQRQPGIHSVIDFEKVPLITDDLKNYIDQKCVPGGTNRNWDSYGDKIGNIDNYQRSILADPQTSGGLLIAVEPKEVKKVEAVLKEYFPDQKLRSIGYFMEKGDYTVTVK